MDRAQPDDETGEVVHGTLGHAPFDDPRTTWPVSPYGTDCVERYRLPLWVHAAADALRAAAPIAEPRGRGPITTAADAYARASRELHGRTPTRTTAGFELRSTAKALPLLGRAGGNERVAMMALITSLQGLMEATAELREAQDRTAQAVAARRASIDLQAAADGVRAAVGSRALTRP